MAQHWLVDFALSTLGWIFIIASSTFAALPIWLFRKNPYRHWIWTGWAIVVGFAFLSLFRFVDGRLEESRKEEQALRDQLAAPKARLAELCKGAGERILKTVDDVEGVVWLKWREFDFNASDPFGADCAGEECIKNLLGARRPTPSGDPIGYRFVETTDPRDGKKYRYTLRPNPERKYEPYTLARTSIAKYTAKFGITWENISTQEDLQQWIAGSALRVIDLDSGELLAERVGYVFDSGQGSTRNGRLPWIMARWNACPSIPQMLRAQPGLDGGQTFPFVAQSLKPLAR